MVATLDAEWLRECTRSGAELVTWVRITGRKISDGTYDTRDYCTGTKRLQIKPAGTYAGSSAAPAIHPVEPVALEIDAKTRSFSVAQQTLTFHDTDAIRDFVSTHYIYGQLATIKLGTHTISDTDSFVLLGTHLVEGLEYDYSTVTLSLGDMKTALEKISITSEFIARHPIDCIKRVLEESRIPTSLYTAADLDWTTYTTESHWCVTRAATDSGKPEAVNSQQLIDELNQLMYSTFIPDETGKFRFKLYDQAAAADRTWDSSIVANVRSAENIWDNTITRINVLHKATNPKDTWQADVWSSGWDAATETVLAASGESFTSVMEIESRWVGGIKQLRVYQEPYNTNASQTYFISDGTPSQLGFCGTQYQGTPQSYLINGTRPTQTEARLSATRLARFVVLDRNKNQAESLTCDDAYTQDWNSGFADRSQIVQVPERNNTGSYGGRIVSRSMAFEFAARNVAPSAGTSNFHYESWVYDSTLISRLYDQLLNRFSLGSSVVDLETGLDQIDIQIGDVISFDHPTYIAHGNNGSAAKMEVIRKEVIPATGSISWRLCAINTHGDHDNSGSVGGRGEFVDVVTEAGVIVTDGSRTVTKQ